MKIGLFADSHYCTKDILCKTRRPSLSLHKIQEALDFFKSEGVDFIICLGDLIDHDDSEQKNRENLEKAAAVIYSSEIKCYCCIGNHDADMFGTKEFSSISGFETAPLSISAGGKLIILLNANYGTDGREYAQYNVDWKSTLIPENQAEWLSDTLKNSREDDAYIFVHQNLDNNVQVNHIISNADKIRGIIARSGKVRAVYQGHYHPGAQSVIDGISYITLKAMCEGEGNFFTVIEI